MRLYVGLGRALCHFCQVLTIIPKSPKRLPRISNRTVEDDWPKMPDGTDFDGKQRLSLVRSGNSLFHGAWDVNLLVREIEKNLGAQVIGIPVVSKGFNNYESVQSLRPGSMLRLRLGNTWGFHLKLSNGLEIVASLARGDVKVPNYAGFPIHVEVPKAKFEVAVYELLRSEPNILASCLLYYRSPDAKVRAYVKNLLCLI
jgi:hypothetical protein